MILFRKYKKKTLRIVFCFSLFYTYICCFLFFFPILPKRKKNKANMLRSFLFWIAHLSNSFAIYGLARRELMLRKRKQTQRKGWFIHAGMTSSLFDHSQHFFLFNLMLYWLSQSQNCAQFSCLDILRGNFMAFYKYI